MPGRVATFPFWEGAAPVAAPVAAPGRGVHEHETAAPLARLKRRPVEKTTRGEAILLLADGVYLQETDESRKGVHP